MARILNHSTQERNPFRIPGTTSRKQRRQDYAIQKAAERKERINKNRNNAMFILRQLSKQNSQDIDLKSLHYLMSVANQPYLR